MAHKLFEPYQLKSLPLKNRIVMAPMTRCRAVEGDEPTALMAEYYGQRATAGLIVTEGVPVSPVARGYLWTPGIYSAGQVAGWRQVAEAVHEAGGRIFVQIWHTGRVSHRSLQPGGGAPEGPTDELSADTTCFAYDADGNPGNVPTSQPQGLDAGGLLRVCETFAQAARNAREAGMDGVEIHGANGYLFDQFLNSVVNTRNDVYGGSVENRCRLLLETVDAVADAIGAERTAYPPTADSTACPKTRKWKRPLTILPKNSIVAMSLTYTSTIRPPSACPRFPTA
jgi:N-ethylmaleimide reductase